jgi:60 kDa SS-A/Ro ribonucleoprotein
MAKSTYATAFATKKTPQTQAIPGREAEMKQNNAGGVTFTITPVQMLERFLILGSNAPTYYSSARKLTTDNADNIRACLKADGKRTVDKIVEISVAGRAPSNDPAIFALAVASTPEFGSQETALYALSQLTKVCRIGTHLFHFAEYLTSMRGFGRAVKRELGLWYTDKNEGQLAYQILKYQSRDGWSHKDILSLAHVKTSDPLKSAVLAWSAIGGLDALAEAEKNWTRSTKKYNLSEQEINQRRHRYGSAYSLLSSGVAPKIIVGYEAAKKATTTKEIVKIIRDTKLSHEMIPTQFKTEPEVWMALLENGMPLTAMVRNLGQMSKIGLLKPLSDASKLVVSRLSDQQFIQKSRLHPLAIMLAQGTYRQGHGMRSDSTWDVVPTVVDALEDAFYLAFANVIPTGKSIFIGLDISGSMRWSYIGATGISAAQAGAAMALVIARTEPNYAIYGFSTSLIDLGITKKDTLESAMKKTSDRNFGGTDCAQPMVYAEKKGLTVDSFVTITDSETWAGKIQPIQALQSYRKARGKNDVSMIVVGMTSTGFSIADPQDPYNLDVVGFDAAIPSFISDFIRGTNTGISEDTEE